jgi:protein disulfide-isomerase
VTFFRVIIFSAVVLTTACTEKSIGPYDKHADPFRDLESAVQEAGRGDKTVLLIFGANWCPDCKQLQIQLQSEPLVSMIESEFEVVYVDVGNWNRNIDFAKQYNNPHSQGIPAIVVLDKDKITVETANALELASVSKAVDGLADWL